MHGNTAQYHTWWSTLRKCSDCDFSFLHDFARVISRQAPWTDLPAEQAGLEEAEKQTHINNAGNAPINACHCQSPARCNHPASDGMSDSPLPCGRQTEAFLWKAVRQTRDVCRELTANWRQPGSAEAVADVLLFEPILSSCSSHAEAAGASCTCGTTNCFALAGGLVVGSLSSAVALVFLRRALIKLVVGFNTSLPPIVLLFVASFQAVVNAIHNPLPQ